MIDDSGFTILNDGSPTHQSFSYDTKEALDLTFVSPDLSSSCNWKVLDNIGSDHLPILIELNKRQAVFGNFRRKFWNFRRADWKIYENLTEIKIKEKPLADNLEANWVSLKKIIKSSAKLSIPRGNFKKKNPFITSKSPSLQSLLEERRKILSERNNANSRSNLNKINGELKLLFTKLKRDKWNELCAGLDPRSSDGKLWKLVKNINREQPQTEQSNTIKNSDGRFAQNDEQAANILGEHYQNMSKLSFTSDDKNVKKTASNIIRNCRSKHQRVSPIFSRDFGFQELDTAIKTLKLNKAPGPDGIHAQMIYNLGQTGKQRLLDIFNESWRLGRLPREWRKAIVVPVRKPNKESISPKSYRPIALTCIVCKVMEKMILERLTFHLTSNGLLPKEQYGFREGHCTTDQVLFFCQKIRDAHNMKPTNHTVAAFLDLSKAFDRVWNQKLITKLFDVFGVRGRILAWIYDFLRNRTIRVNFNGSISRSFKLHQGVPQGSVLSPTLFSLFMKGIESVIPEDCDIGLFADDIVLWKSGTDLKNLDENINTALSELWTFADEHKMSFNPEKSTVSFFTTNRKLYSYEPNILFNNQPLTVEKHPKYLGFVLDPEILGNKHIDHLVVKARKRLKILKYISGRDWGADAFTLRNTYISLIRPILEYGCPIYCCASDTGLQKLERIQLSAARIITGLRNSCPCEIVLFEADLQPLSLRRGTIMVKYYSKLRSLGSENRTSEFLETWQYSQRLKRNSPFSQAYLSDNFAGNVEQHFLKQIIDPSDGLCGVSFHADLPVCVNKQTDLPSFLRQVALERISDIPMDAVQIYTDGSKNEDNCTGSGIYVKSQGKELRIQKRNTNFCSVFRSELIAIDEGLDTIKSLPLTNEIWILSDSKSAIEHLANWKKVRDLTGANILKKLKTLSQTHRIHFQWIPSHVDISGNEIADGLAKAGAAEVTAPSVSLTSSEIVSIVKLRTKKDWLNPPSHSWYKGDHPGGCLSIDINRQYQTAITRLRSGHTMSLKYSCGAKVFDLCKKCTTEQASPNHILTCMGLTTDDLRDRPGLVIDFLRVNDLLELI